MDPFVRLFDEVRLLEHRLVQVADTLHAGGQVSLPGRAVLEFLRRHGPTSVPDIARARYVSRQHIQSIVDGLTDSGLVQPSPNAAHRRSPLFGLTDRGRSTIVSMQKREHQLMQRRFKTIDRHDIDNATAVLAAVRTALDDEDSR